MDSDPRGHPSKRQLGCLTVSFALSAALLALVVTATPVLAVDASQTTISVTGTLASPQTMTGTITLNGAAPDTRYVLVSSFQGLPESGASSRIYTGTYKLTFTHCIGGTVLTDNEPELINSGEVLPGQPPASRAAPIFVTLPGSTSMRCEYHVAFNGQAPPGAVDSLRGELWVMEGGSTVTHAAGPVVPAPFPPPISVPEAPYAPLLPGAALTLFGLALFFLQGRSHSGRDGAPDV